MMKSSFCASALSASSKPARLSAVVMAPSASRTSASPRSIPAIAAESPVRSRERSIRRASASTSAQSDSTAWRGSASVSCRRISARSLRNAAMTVSRPVDRIDSICAVIRRSCSSSSGNLTGGSPSLAASASGGAVAGDGGSGEAEALETGMSEASAESHATPSPSRGAHCGGVGAPRSSGLRRASSSIWSVSRSSRA